MLSRPGNLIANYPGITCAGFRDALRQIAFVPLFLIFASTGHADYQPIPLHQLIRGADLIVLGSVAEVDQGNFRLDSVELIHGAKPAQVVQIEKYSDWTGSRRWASYRQGQTVLLFLSAVDASTGARWKIMGLGGEGEIPVENGFIYPREFELKISRRQKYAVQQGQLFGYRFPQDMFLSAVRGYLRCFDQDPARSGAGLSTPKLICQGHELAEFRRESRLHNYLAEVSTEHQRGY